MEKVSEVVIYAGIVQGLFVAFLLNSRGVRRSRANVFLSVLLVALSFSIAHSIFAGALFHHLSMRIYSVGDPTFLLIAPLIGFYTTELTGRRVRMNVRAWLHVVPFLVVILLPMTFGVSRNPEVMSFLETHHRALVVVFWAIIVIQFSGYLFVLHRRWVRSNAEMVYEVSNPENVNIAWVRFFMGVFLLVNVFFLFCLFAVIHLDSRAWLWKANALTLSLSIFALGYKGILQREIFDTNKFADPVLPESTPQDVVRDDAAIARVRAFMEERKPYLDAELTLSTLAKELAMSRSQLSQLINEGIGDNFYNFVNQYRVEEVKRLMQDARFSNYNLLGLALEAGFKSKSTFNLIFKRFTGLTPTEYRKNITL